MMLNFFTLPRKDKEEALRVSQANLGISESILEKDIWVSYFLDLIFNRLDLGHRFMFKGGTSLSKCYSMINRFSEDIDLSLNMEDLGFGGADSPESALSKSQRTKRLNELRDAGVEYTVSVLLPAIKEKLAEDSLLSTVDVSIEKMGNDVDIIVKYITFSSGSEYNTYFRPEIKIEPGAKAKHEPTEDIKTSPLIGESIPDFQQEFHVKVLDPQRTFWEKATYVHVVNNCGDTQKVQNRMSRHMYDLAMMAKHSKGQEAIRNIELLAQVVEHKSLYFASGWADYSGAKPGTLKLFPPAGLMDTFRSDYRAMEIMLYDLSPTFDEVLVDIQRIEDEVNQ
jgi:hypothetical protein